MNIFFLYLSVRAICFSRKRDARYSNIWDLPRSAPALSNLPTQKHACLRAGRLFQERKGWLKQKLRREQIKRKQLARIQPEGGDLKPPIKRHARRLRQRDARLGIVSQHGQHARNIPFGRDYAMQ